MPKVSQLTTTEDTFESKSCQKLIRDVFAGKGGIERKARDYQSIGTIKIL